MNKNKVTPFIIALVVLIAGLGIAMTSQNSKPAYPQNKNSAQNTTSSPASSTTVDTSSNDTQNTNPTPKPTPSPKPTPTPTPTPKPTVSGYTLAQVAAHGTASDCWTTINGSVYNVTSWIDQHPGGAQAIISMCGIDGSDGFNGQHGGERRPANELAAYKIGILK